MLYSKFQPRSQSKFPSQFIAYIESSSPGRQPTDVSTPVDARSNQNPLSASFPTHSMSVAGDRDALAIANFARGIATAVFFNSERQTSLSIMNLASGEFGSTGSKHMTCRKCTALKETRVGESASKPARSCRRPRGRSSRFFSLMPSSQKHENLLAASYIIWETASPTEP